MSLNRRPTILFVTSVYPHGPEYGAQQRVLNVLRILSGIGDVSLLFAVPTPIDKDAIEATAEEFRVVHTALVTAVPSLSWSDRFRFELDPSWLNGNLTGVSEEDRMIIRDLVNQHNVTWVHTLRTANECLIWRWPRTILDIDYIPSQVSASSRRSGANLMRKALDWRMSIIWRRRESLVPQRFNVVTVCSGRDRDYVGSNTSRVHVVPNGFVTAKQVTKPEPAIPPRLGFVGWFGGLPNREGIQWFLRDIWPAIKREVPDARLRLIGADSDAGMIPAAPDTDILGYLEDPSGEIATWSAMVVPIRVGSGTRIKIAHAFSLQCPVVSTSLGVFGYEVSNGDELLIADTAEEFARASVGVMQEPEIGRRLAERAWNKYSKAWTWDAIAPAVRAAVEDVLSDRSDDASVAGAAIEAVG